MTAGLRGLGYGPERTVGNYGFSDVASEGVASHSVELAAFTHFPPSYRSAAFSLLEGGGRGRSGKMGWLASLGAPIAFVVEGEKVRVVRVGASGVEATIRLLAPDDVSAFIQAQQESWAPEGMRRLKLSGGLAPELPGQLDFFDSGLLPAVATLTRKRLEKLLADVIGSMRTHFGALDRPALTLAFRLLAAKVLLDKKHPATEAWAEGIDGALKGVEAFYGLPSQSYLFELRPGSSSATMAVTWRDMQSAMSLANVSSDDLAFVYENSFVSDASRKSLGTHSTPREVVDYACDRLPLDLAQCPGVSVIEPFSGAGVFLIEAVRRLSEQVANLSPPARHAFLVERVEGADLDEFACEVARLALVLADYPNRNGWRIEVRDLFVSSSWLDRIGPDTVVFCNPPYEDFTRSERLKYSVAMTEETNSKPVWAAWQIIGRKPAAFALVLPRAFALERKWQALRAAIEGAYAEVEVLALPENTFANAAFETCLVIANNPRGKNDATSRVTSSLLVGADLPVFRAGGKPTWSRTSERTYDRAKSGVLWGGDLEPVWEDLRAKCELLGALWDVHRGIEWVSKHQKTAWSSTKPSRESRPGYHPNDGMLEFEAPVAGYLDVRPDHLRRRADRLPWDQPKVMLNAARRSRGPWRVTAFVERGDFAASQQFIAVWPKSSGLSLEALAAVLNGPVANAFLDAASFGKGLRLSHLKNVPLPLSLDQDTAADLVRSYLGLLKEPGFDDQKQAELRRALLRIDAHVLAAYELDPALEAMLLNQFEGHTRQVPFKFSAFYSKGAPALSLRRLLEWETKRPRWTISKETVRLIAESRALDGLPEDFF